MAYHLLKDYDMALKILEEYRKTQMVCYVFVYPYHIYHIICCTLEPFICSTGLPHIQLVQKFIHYVEKSDKNQD